jgi:hypothetical protein
VLGGALDPVPAVKLSPTHATITFSVLGGIGVGLPVAVRGALLPEMLPEAVEGALDAPVIPVGALDAPVIPVGALDTPVIPVDDLDPEGAFEEDVTATGL